MNELPHGWTVANIEQLAGVEGLTSDGDWIESKDQDPGGTVRLIQLADVGEGEFRNRSSRFVTTETAQRLNCTFLQSGDVLIARMPDPLGRACVFPGIGQPAITAVDVFIWRGPPDGPSARWLVHFINSRDLRTSILDQAGGTTRQRISGGRLKKLVVPVPPLSEQQRIVAKIDSLSAKSGRARAHLDHIPRLVGKYKQAILASAFRGKLTSHQHPSDFVSRSFHEVVESTFYGPRIAKEAYVSRGIPTLRTTDLEDWGKIVLREPPQVTVSPAELVKWGFRHGDLMVTRTGATIGKCAVYDSTLGPAIPSAYLIRVRLKLESIDPTYAVLFMLSPQGQQQLLDGRTAVAQPNINAGAITALQLPLPTLEVQKRIVSTVKTSFAWIDHLASEASSARKLIDHFDQAVLAKAFRGELVPQAPDDEPASVLMERIKASRGLAAPTGGGGKRRRKASA